MGLGVRAHMAMFVFVPFRQQLTLMPHSRSPLHSTMPLPSDDFYDRIDRSSPQPNRIEIEIEIEIEIVIVPPPTTTGRRRRAAAQPPRTPAGARAERPPRGGYQPAAGERPPVERDHRARE